MIKFGEILGKNSYQSQLASEKWNEFSKQIRATRNFCECCRQANKTLQVHHLFYEPGKNLWEYADGDLLVLCRECHQELHSQLKMFRKITFRYLTPRMFQLVNAALRSGLTKYDPLTYCHALCEFTENKRLIENHARAWYETKQTEKRD